VDISSQSLDARIGSEGAFAQFPNTTEGIAALSERAPNVFQFGCPRRQVFVCGVEFGGGESKDLHFVALTGHSFNRN
jgi:hypothetical protein